MKKKVRIYKDGGPTTQDSMDVYNNTQALLSYYRGKGYEETPAHYSKGPYDFNKMNSPLQQFQKNSASSQGILYPTKSGGTSYGPLPTSVYRQNIDDNRFKQREDASGVLDTRAPMPLYDKRITPSANYRFVNRNPNDPLYADEVNIQGYDPLAIKPYHMLTPQERAMRDTRYGTKPQQQPIKPKPTTPQIPITGEGDYTVIQAAPEQHIYRYGTREQADSAVNAATGQYSDVRSGMATKQQYGGKIKSISPEDAAISNVLMNRNRDKNFVDRAYNNNTAPRLQTNKIPGYENMSNNQYSTELMAYDNNPDGTARVYPEIVQKPGDKGLTYLGGDKAWDYADSTGQYINTPTSKIADMFSSYGYKHASGIPIQQYGGYMKKKVRISAPPMEYGGAIPGMGDNLNSYGRQNSIANQSVDTRWRQYGTPSDVYAYAPNPYQTKTALPKVPEDQADIVIEKKESVLGDFDGDGSQELMIGNSGTHESGNDQPVSVPDNSFVFSDTKALKIKDKNILKQFGKSSASTPAQLANQYTLQKYIQDPKDDKLTNKTKEMMYNNYQAKLGKIASIQEGMKQQMQAKKDQKQMKMGGYMSHYTGGGPTVPYYGYNDVASNQADMVSQHPQAAWFAQNVMEVPASGSLVDNQQGYRTQFMNGIQPYHDNQDIQPIEPAGLTPNGLPSNQDTGNQYAPGTMDNTGTKRVRVSHPGSFWNKAAVYGASPDALGDAALGLKAMNIQKFKPWEPPVTAVIPEATYLDPTRELAANSEQAAMAYNSANQSANSKAARSAAGAYQGQALKNAADITGRYNNSNVQIANQANQQAAAITNQMLQEQRERAKSLNSDMFNANRLYQGELNQATDELVKRAYEKEDKERNRTWINQTNPYYQLDSRGFPVFNSANARDKFMADKQRLESGLPVSGTGKERTKDDWVKYYNTLGVSGDDANEMALDQIAAQTKVARTRTQYDKSGNVKGKTVSAPQQQMGGFNRTQLRRFIEGRGGY